MSGRGDGKRRKGQDAHSGGKLGQGGQDDRRSPRPRHSPPMKKRDIRTQSAGRERPARPVESQIPKEVKPERVIAALELPPASPRPAGMRFSTEMSAPARPPDAFPQKPGGSINEVGFIPGNSKDRRPGGGSPEKKVAGIPSCRKDRPTGKGSGCRDSRRADGRRTSSPRLILANDLIFIPEQPLDLLPGHSAAALLERRIERRDGPAEGDAAETHRPFAGIVPEGEPPRHPVAREKFMHLKRQVGPPARGRSGPAHRARTSSRSFRRRAHRPNAR